MKPVLLIDFGSTYTKVTAIDIESESILGTARAFTTVQTDISNGLDNAMTILEKETGKLDYLSRLACSSAAGGLKMITVGLVPDLTAEAARRAALSAGAKVTGVYSYELSASDADEIQNMKPDIVLLTGGTDGGNKKVLLHNAKIIAEIEGSFPVVVAGNKSTAEEAKSILLSSGKDVRVCQNVMPDFNRLNIEPARTAIREVFLQRIVRAKGLTKVQKLIEGILMPTPSAVLKAVQVLSSGSGREQGLGDIVAIDIGGATTDVYSVTEGIPSKSGVIIKGLPEPFAKRTVEGDLGVRYSATFLTETVGIEKIADASGLMVDEVKACLELIRNQPEILPYNDKKLEKLDITLASMAVKEAVSRHSGKIETVYTPMGVAYVQIGKDLSKIKRIVGTGGPVVNSSQPRDILRHVLFDQKEPAVLKPLDAEVLVDKKYILAAMGLLCEIYPETALRIMKKELRMI